MDMNMIMDIYDVNGIKDYKLRDTRDLLNCHGFDYKAIDGYEALDDLNRHIYKTFILNIFNAHGLESRASLKPMGIYFVEDIEGLCKEDPSDDYYLVKTRMINSIDRNGVKSNLYSWEDDEFKDYEVLISEFNNYLRFEYKDNDKFTWLHVIESGEEWY